ncbi:hypothetical protein GQ54DRAFT_295278 [Martensiomyces pterosporus]|nr:hypothetical protein GQ54DRAFT_295278 [Martensiomyces pterosporus]
MFGEEEEFDPHRDPVQFPASSSSSGSQGQQQHSTYAEGGGNPFGGAASSSPWGNGGADNGSEGDTDQMRNEEDDGEEEESDAASTTAYQERDSGVNSTSSNHSQSQGEPNSQTPAPLLTFTVGRLVDRAKRVPAYTFDVLTNIPSYKARKYTGVERNQVEFERLEAHLRATYPECLVPTLGPGTTVSKYVPDYQNDRLVVMLLQQWLNRVSVHPILRQDYELRQFVEAPFAFNPALASSASVSALSMSPHSSGSTGSGFFSWGKSKQRIARSSNPTPFEMQLEKTSENLAVFQKNVSEARRWHGRLARTRMRLSVDLRDVGGKLVSVGVIEHSGQLARAFKRFGKCFLHAGSCAQSQANMEGSRTIAVEDIYTMACDNVQKTLNNRQVIFTEHQVAERQLERKRQAVAVLRASSSINADQVQETLDEFNVAKADADSKRERAERVDRVLAADLRAFEANREHDLKSMFGSLAKDQLHVEKQVLGEFKAVLAFIRHGNGSAPAPAAPAPAPAENDSAA